MRFPCFPADADLRPSGTGTGPVRDGMADGRITDAWVVDRLDTIYPAYRHAFARLLVVLRQEFDGDLDAMMVLLSVSLDVMRDDWREGLFEAQTVSRQSRLTNTQSIAETTGIPRESVRRKLARMQAKGWIERTGDGGWRPTPQASADLRAGSSATVTFIAAVIAAAVAAKPTSRQTDETPHD
jgi:hypothetical protein